MAKKKTKQINSKIKDTPIDNEESNRNTYSNSLINNLMNKIDKELDNSSFSNNEFNSISNSNCHDIDNDYNYIDKKDSDNNCNLSLIEEEKSEEKMSSNRETIVNSISNKNSNYHNHKNKNNKENVFFPYPENMNLSKELNKLNYELEKINEEKKVIFEQGVNLDSEKSELKAQLRFFTNYLEMLKIEKSIVEQEIKVKTENSNLVNKFKIENNNNTIGTDAAIDLSKKADNNLEISAKTTELNNTKTNLNNKINNDNDNTKETEIHRKTFEQIDFLNKKRSSEAQSRINSSKYNKGNNISFNTEIGRYDLNSCNNNYYLNASNYNNTNCHEMNYEVIKIIPNDSSNMSVIRGLNLKDKTNTNNNKCNNKNINTSESSNKNNNIYTSSKFNSNFNLNSKKYQTSVIEENIAYYSKSIGK